MKILVKSWITLYYKQKLIRQYWKKLYNDKKIPLIPPLLVDDKFVTDMKTKANIFNKFLVEKCTPLKNNSKLQSSQMFLTQSRLISLDFNEDEILKIVRTPTYMMLMAMMMSPLEW